MNPLSVTVKSKILEWIASHQRPRNWKDASFLQSDNKRQRDAWTSLQNTAVLQTLADYDATLVGTIPLDVDVPGSDLDIVCTAKDLLQFERIVAEHFTQFSSFEIQKTEVAGERTFIAKFDDGHFCYEIFAQSVPVDLQNAYLHLVIEAILLEIGGERARKAIRVMKATGLKTEPAFAKFFGIDGDPYSALRELALDVLSINVSEKDTQP